MTKIVTIHGNPGHHRDLETAAKLLAPEGSSIEAFDLDRSRGYNHDNACTQLAPTLENGEQTTLLTYSWGTYLAVTCLAARGLKVAQIIALNPTLHMSEAVSPAVSTLAKTPLVGSVLLGILNKSLTEDFCRKSFLPTTPEPDLEEAFQENLAKVNVWKRAIEVKNHQYANPLTSVPEVAGKIHLIFGDDDQSVSKEAQQPAMETLKKNNNVTTYDIKGAGHSLPWTHHNDLQNIFSKIWSA